MARITINMEKSIEENAGNYFDKAKQLKKKLVGVNEALVISRKKLDDLQKKQEIEEQSKVKVKQRERAWYEKFRWFYTSEGMLVLGGRDATSNELIVKKNTEKDDIVFHTDMAGSPFFVIKVEDKKPTEKSLNEVAQATASYSRAWKLGFPSVDTFYVRPEQVSKQAPHGEYVERGAFIISGKTNNLHAKVGLAIGIKENNIIGGPIESIKANAEKFMIIEQGDNKASDVAKKIKHKIGGEIDDIIRFLPSGGCRIK